MKRVWAGILLLGLPLAVFAQDRSILREAEPADPPAIVLPPDDSINAAPLPPPDQETQPEQGADAQPEMVPNPLRDPNEPAGPRVTRVPQQQGQPQRGAWVQMGTATLQALDKVNAHAETLNVKVGDVGHFGSLDISVRGCYVRAPDRPADATAFVVIHDERPDAPGFTGWMVRSAPYMSMLAHPIYDIRVAGCSS